ncbi:MAG: alpha/beta fold hydrolase [Acidobacteria bacterium]|nr:alpha/beta fold hydrolase [Acidobacteriota bacterium]
MSLETIHRKPDNGHATPIVLLHGAWHGAWAWDNGFVDRLVDGGFEVLALSLRGHGDSSGSARFASLGKYLADLSSVVEDLDRAPVVVGHSIGGLITQRLIAKRPVAGAVLMASVSPRGPWALTLSTATKHPWLFAKSAVTLSLGPLVSSESLVRDLFLTTDTPEQLVGWTSERLMAESYIAYVGMFLGAPAKKVKGLPMLVIGADWDAVFPPTVVR